MRIVTAFFGLVAGGMLGGLLGLLLGLGWTSLAGTSCFGGVVRLRRRSLDGPGPRAWGVAGALGGAAAATVRAAALLAGFLLGAGLGARGGWLLGETYVGWAGTSCFEGRCGFVTGHWMLGGLALGAGLGPWIAGRLLRASMRR